MASNLPESLSVAEIERLATDWFFRRDAGFTAAEAAAFERWRAEDERHASAFAEIERTWRTLGEAEPQVRHAIAAMQRWRSPLLVFPALVAAAAIAIGIFVWRSPAQRHATAFAEQASTEVGGMRNLGLPDGSLVTLNTNSAVEVQFTAAERRIRLLRGEAHFTVARNPHRPFIVEASGVAVHAVGTAFNVRRRADAVEVLVTEGKVRVADAARDESLLASSATPPATRDAAVLTAGEKVVVAVKGGSAPQRAHATNSSAVEIEQALAWQKRRLQYVDVPLSEIVADFNRYNEHRLVIPDARLSAQRFGGTFPAGDYGSFVQLLESTFGVVVERRERETVLRLP